MVDPVHFTNYGHTLCELQEKILFSVLVAGKNALTTARRLEALLGSAHWKCGIYGRFAPFESLRPFPVEELRQMLQDSGIGCHTAKGRSVYEIVHSGLDLRACGVEALEEIYGIGLKTSRMFVLHTRREAEVACLDTHLLKFLRDLGHDVPQSTPQSKGKYRELESIFLQIARGQGVAPAHLDLEVWRHYAGHKVA